MKNSNKIQVSNSKTTMMMMNSKWTIKCKNNKNKSKNHHPRSRTNNHLRKIKTSIKNKAIISSKQNRQQSSKLNRNKSKVSLIHRIVCSLTLWKECRYCWSLLLKYSKIRLTLGMKTKKMMAKKKQRWMDKAKIKQEIVNNLIKIYLLRNSGKF